MGSQDRDHSVAMGRAIFCINLLVKVCFSSIYPNKNHTLDGLVIDNTSLPVHVTCFKVSTLTATSLAAQFLMC